MAVHYIHLYERDESQSRRHRCKAEVEWCKTPDGDGTADRK